MRPSLGQTLVAVATLVVVASIIAGLVLIGSSARTGPERLEAGGDGDRGGMTLDARPVLNPCHACHPERGPGGGSGG